MNFKTGDLVWWEDQLYLTGYTGAPVRAMFIKYRVASVKNCGIAVQMRNGTWRPKWVSAERVKPRNGGESKD
jgi:hypothetical protein